MSPALWCTALVLGTAKISLLELQTIIVLLNDRPLACQLILRTRKLSLHPTYLRDVVSQPHEKVDDEEINHPDNGNNDELTKRTKRQALLLQHLRNRWKTRYLTS